jgi:hypothetical protein
MILLRAVFDLDLSPSYKNPARDFLMSDKAAHLASLIGFDLWRAIQRRGFEHE